MPLLVKQLSVISKTHSRRKLPTAKVGPRASTAPTPDKPRTATKQLQKLEAKTKSH